MAVVTLALVAFLAKAVVATRTFGTQDINAWTRFADAVRQRGPIGIYEIDFRALHRGLYNHPPLVGYYLLLINQLSDWGVQLKASIRIISSAADVVSALLVFEILRRRVSLLRATASGLSVAMSPVLFLVAGYHGNTDPMFVMFVLLGSFLIVDRELPFLGGVALGLAIGIKLVPVVVLATIAVYLVRQRPALLRRATTGFAATFLLSWTPAVVREWSALQHNVLGYSGTKAGQWGLVRFANDLGWTQVARFVTGPGTNLIVLVCALVPAALTWWRPTRVMESVALSLVAFLALSPTFGAQYLVWGLAAAYLLDFWSATFFNVLGGLLLYVIYDRWNGGLPWVHVAAAHVWSTGEIAQGSLVWASLLVVLFRGVGRLLRGGPADPAGGAAGAAAGDGPGEGARVGDDSRPLQPGREPNQVPAATGY